MTPRRAKGLMALAVLVALGVWGGVTAYRYTLDEDERWLLSQYGVVDATGGDAWGREVRVIDAEAARSLEDEILAEGMDMGRLNVVWDDGATGVRLQAGERLPDDVWQRADRPVPEGMAKRVLGTESSSIAIDDLDAVSEIGDTTGVIRIAVLGRGEFTAEEGTAASMLEGLRRVVAAGFDPSLYDRDDGHVRPVMLVPSREIVDAALTAGDATGWVVSDRPDDVNSDSIETGPWVEGDEKRLREWADFGRLEVTAERLVLLADGGLDCSRLFGAAHTRDAFLRCGGVSASGTDDVGARLEAGIGVRTDGMRLLAVHPDRISVSVVDVEAAPEAYESLRRLDWPGELPVTLMGPDDLQAEVTSTATGEATDASGDQRLIDAWNATAVGDA